MVKLEVLAAAVLIMELVELQQPIKASTVDKVVPITRLIQTVAVAVVQVK
jgi:hypothetical protein